MRKTIFQQDGAPALTTKVNLHWLRRVFGNRVVSKGCDMTWPPRSPDLTPPDYFLWGYLHVKLKIRERRPTTLKDLKRCILEEIEALNGKMRLPELCEASKKMRRKRRRACYRLDTF